MPRHHHRTPGLSSRTTSTPNSHRTSSSYHPPHTQIRASVHLPLRLRWSQRARDGPCSKAKSASKIRPKWTQTVPVVVEPESLARRLEDLAHGVPPACLELRRLAWIGSHDVYLEAWILALISGRFGIESADTSLAGAAFEGRFEGSAF
jgi:hypothetical protein